MRQRRYIYYLCYLNSHVVKSTNFTIWDGELGIKKNSLIYGCLPKSKENWPNPATFCEISLLNYFVSLSKFQPLCSFWEERRGILRREFFSRQNRLFSLINRNFEIKTLFNFISGILPIIGDEEEDDWQDARNKVQQRLGFKNLYV